MDPATNGTSLKGCDAIANAVSTIGTPGFDAALLDAVSAFAPVDHVTVLTFRPDERIKTLCIASRTDLGRARSLTRDYLTQHYAMDPNFTEFVRPSRSRRIVVKRHDPARLRTRAYQQRFYTTFGIVDKVSYLWRTSDASFYANLYRTTATGRYREVELRKLSGIARLIASLVRMHAGRKRLEAALATGNLNELAERLVALLGEKLTAREQAVLARILLGMGTQGIALDLGVGPASVITFRKRAYAKLGITSQSELFARCLRVLPKLPIQ